MRRVRRGPWQKVVSDYAIRAYERIAATRDASRMRRVASRCVAVHLIPPQFGSVRFYAWLSFCAHISRPVLSADSVQVEG
jgi:hypothetical protein